MRAGNLWRMTMIISDEEALNLIEMLISKYAPPGMDKVNVLDKLHGINKINLEPLTDKCPKCKGTMDCLKCNDIDVDVGYITSNITVRLGNKIIYEA